MCECVGARAGVCGGCWQSFKEEGPVDKTGNRADHEGSEDKYKEYSWHMSDINCLAAVAVVILQLAEALVVFAGRAMVKQEKECSGMR